MDSTDYAAAVASQIRQAIRSAGETEASIALKTGIPRTTLQRRLNSSGIHPFTVREIKDIARVLNVTAASLSIVYTDRSVAV